VETIIDRSTLEELRASLRGAAYAPGETDYDEARKAWNLQANGAARAGKEPHHGADRSSRLGRRGHREI
jgi:hypothetical protein